MIVSLLVLQHIQTVKLMAGFEVLTAVTMKRIIFWDMRPCSPLAIY
jgi:hypothetical protein